MIALGIDPGSRRTGWGVISVEGSRLRWLASGVIAAPKNVELPERIESIFSELNLVLQAHAVQHAFVESIFHHKNARSALVLGHARGVALLAARLARVPVLEVSPAEVKKGVTGHGRAEKAQVQEMVRIILGLSDRPQEDEADALAVAIAGTARLSHKPVPTGVVAP